MTHHLPTNEVKNNLWDNISSSQPDNMREGQTSLTAACHGATPQFYVRHDYVPPLPSGSAETGVAHTSDCVVAAPSVYAPPEAETGSNPRDPPHLGE